MYLHYNAQTYVSVLIQVAKPKAHFNAQEVVIRTNVKAGQISSWYHNCPLIFYFPVMKFDDVIPNLVVRHHEPFLVIQKIRYLSVLHSPVRQQGRQQPKAFNKSKSLEKKSWARQIIQKNTYSFYLFHNI